MRLVLAVLLLTTFASAAKFEVTVVARGSHTETYTDVKTVPAWSGWHQTTKSFEDKVNVPYLRLRTPDREFVVTAKKLKHLPGLGSKLVVDNSKQHHLIVTINGKDYDCPIEEERLLGKPNDPLGIR